MMLAILFGLSMDYQVFLVSRMHEEWVQHRGQLALGADRPGRDRPRDHRGGDDHDPRLRVVPARRPAGDRGVRHRPRERGLPRRVHPAHRARARGDAPDRRPQLVAAARCSTACCRASPWRARRASARTAQPRSRGRRPRRARGTTRRPRSRSSGRSGPASSGTTSSSAPSSVITAGTSRQRTIVASTATATPMPTPNCLTVGSPLMTKAKKTLTMISAAEVMTRPVCATPSMTAWRLSPVRSRPP